MSQYKATIMDEEAVKRAIKRISHEILEKNGGCDNICIIGVKRRGVPLAGMIAANIADIEKKLVPCGNLDITFYRDDLVHTSADPVLHSSQIPFEITGKRVIIVDDVLYTGRTARAAIDAVISRGRPEAIQLAVLVDRGHRELPIRGDYVGKNVPTAKTERISVKLPPFDDGICVELFD